MPMFLEYKRNTSGVNRVSDVKLKFGGYQKPASIHNQAAARFGELLRDRLGGDLTFELIGDVLALGRKSGDLPLMVENGELACCSRKRPALKCNMVPIKAAGRC